MASDKSVDAHVVVPFSVTDFAKALRELIQLFRDAAGLAGDGINQVRRHEARQRAGDLAYLAFPVGGFLAPLGRIAAGQIEATNFDDLERQLAETANEVQQRVFSLHRYDAVVRENCGMAAANKFSALLDGPGGKYEIRYDIEGLIRSFRAGATAEDLTSQANTVIDKIDGFNTSLVELHDAILPPRGAPK